MGRALIVDVNVRGRELRDPGYADAVLSAARARLLGCDEGQGFRLGRPVSAESIDLSPRQLPVRYGGLRIDSHGAG